MQGASRKPAVLKNPRETAEKIRVTEGTLAKWRLFGRGPSYLKIGSRVYYEESVVEEWIAAQARTSTSDAGQAA